MFHHGCGPTIRDGRRLRGAAEGGNDRLSVRSVEALGPTLPRTAATLPRFAICVHGQN